MDADAADNDEDDDAGAVVVDVTVEGVSTEWGCDDVVVSCGFVGDNVVFPSLLEEVAVADVVADDAAAAGVDDDEEEETPPNIRNNELDLLTSAGFDGTVLWVVD